jgi:predicted acylesterase/phospholipase RssA
MRSFAIARHGRFRRDQERYASDPRVVFLPRVTDRRRPFDFSGAEELIDAGYTSARDFLADQPAVASASG